MGVVPFHTSKWRWGTALSGHAPTRATTCPASTESPGNEVHLVARIDRRQRIAVGDYDAQSKLPVPVCFLDDAGPAAITDRFRGAAISTARWVRS